MDTFFYILVPVYNVEKYINECIESVLNQTYKNYMLVLVDDGSPDRSGKICDEYAINDSRIIVIHQENRGLFATRQRAISYVRNTNKNDNFYIIFLDSDDFLRSNALERISLAIKTYSADLIIYGYERILGTKVVWNYSFGNGIDNPITDKRSLYKKVFSNRQYNSLCSKAVSMRLLDAKVDYSSDFNISYGEDLIQSINLYKDCQKAYFLNEVLYEYRVNPNSMTEKINLPAYLDHRVRTRVMEFLIKEDVFTKDDWSIYLGACDSFVMEDIENVILSRLPVKQKKEFLNDMFNCCYYKHYLYKQKKKYNNVKSKIISSLFENKMMNSLIVIGFLGRFLKK